MEVLDVTLIPAFSDNYIYLLRARGSGVVGIVDPGEAEPVFAALDRLEIMPTHIFNTHHHPDHTGGNEAIKERYPQARLIGPKSEMSRISGLERIVIEGDTISFGTVSFQVIEVPGHTRGHVAFWSEDGNALFCGDTLFSMGCGRLFEGTPQQMWTSLRKLSSLPHETRVYCGHEYSQANARFALTVDPGNAALAKRAAEVDALRKAGEPTIPSTVGLENATNPFLRADRPEIAKAVELDGADPVKVFAEIRARKDKF